MGDGSTQSDVEIDDVKAHRMIERLVRLEKKNIQTRHSSDRDIVSEIKNIIREEAEAYVN